MNSVLHKQRLVGRAGTALLVGTILSGLPGAALAQAVSTQEQSAAPAAAAPASPVADQPAPAPTQVIRSVAVSGAVRIEPETVRAYANLAPGQTYNAEKLDAALKDLYATELFADVVISGADTGNLVITVRENPVINRIVLEGNKKIKDDKILPEIKLAPRQIFTRSKVRTDVDRIIELYKRQGRFGATVEPKIVTLDQNRVDLVFEITEGDQSQVRAINFLGNDEFDDGRLRKELFTREAGGLLGFLKSNDTYDPDRLAADQQKLRAFYLTQGYADFRVVSALAELTPDRRDFVITYVVEEGDRYELGEVEAESELRDFTPDQVKKIANLQPGAWFNAKAIEDAVTNLSEVAGRLGYAFADINPAYNRDAEKKVMNITFRVGETPRVYVERIDIQGNTITRDKVIRREFRLNEGDAFNALRVKRSQDRIQSLGFFQENLEIKQTQGSAPDRVILGVDVEEKSTGELQLSAGYSSLEKFILALSVAQRNFMGKGQELNAGVNFSRYSKSVQLGFTEPYFLDRAILLGGEIYRRDYNSFNFVNDEREETYSQVSTGGGLRLGFPVTEFVSFSTRYSLVFDDVSLDDIYFTDGECDPLKAGRYLCDEIGKHTTSSLGYSLAFDNTNGTRATRGHRLVLSQDFAGLGGDVKYLRTRGQGAKYWGLGGGFIFSVQGEGGYIKSLEKADNDGSDPLRLTDRFFGPQLRGFDIRGIGPRVIRRDTDPVTGEILEDADESDDALGGHAYYMARIELELPVSGGIRSLGLRPSAFVDVGSVFGLKDPELQNKVLCTPTAANPTGQSDWKDFDEDCGVGFNRSRAFREDYFGDTIKPRLSVGVGVNWTSPFGPLRLDIARAILKEEGDETKFFSFNVGTAF